MNKINALKSAGFSDEEVNAYIEEESTKLRQGGFSDSEIRGHFGIANPVNLDMENNSLFSRAKNYLNIGQRLPQTELKSQIPDAPIEALAETTEQANYDDQVADREVRAVLSRGVSGLTGGISELILPDEKPESVGGTIIGAGLELGGFVLGPIKASKLLLGSRLKPTATGLKGMAQILAESGATLGLASGLSRVIPGFLENQDLGSYILDVGQSTAIGGLVGALYPLFGAVPTKPLRLATSLVVMDKIRAGTDQVFTIDDFVQGIQDGSVDQKELGNMAFGYLMDIYFTLKTPSMRAQLRALSERPGADVAKEILKLDADEVGQTVLDIANQKKLEVNGVRDAEGTLESKMRPSMSEEDFVNHANGVVDKLISEKRAMPNERDSLLKKMLQSPDELSKASPETAMELTLKYGPEKELTELATESMLEKGIKRDPSQLMSEQIANEWLSEPYKYKEIASKYGMSVEEFATTLKEQASSWGRKLGQLGLEAQKLGRENPEVAELLDKISRINQGVTAWDRFYGWFKRADNVRRGLLVTQLSTSMRNLETQLGRVGLDVFEKGLDAGLQKIVGKGTTDPMDGVKELIQVFQRSESKHIVEKILKENFKGDYDRLVGSYMSDIEIGGVGQAITKGVDILNTANRFQEYLFRKGIFSATLEQGLKAHGKDLSKIIESNEIGAIQQELIHGAVEKSLEMTFAQTPKKGTPAGLFVELVNKIPGATFALPFPRFLMNALKFQFQYSPFGFTKFLSKAERAAFMSGDTTTMSRAIIGTAMLTAAFLFRESEHAGEHWYELQVGDKTFDMRPFNPFSAYLFIGDLIKKAKDGTLDTMTGKDVMSGVLSSNIKAGTGLFLVDKFFDLFGQGDSEKALNWFKQFAGELISGFFVPLSQVRDMLGGFDESVVREKRTDPFWGPIREKIPFIEKELPEKFTPTREGPLTREAPLLRQLTGLAVKEKTVTEKELDRLGFSWQELFHSTGNAEADNLLQKYMGTYASKFIEPLVMSERYRKMSDDHKADALSQILTKVRAAAKEAASEQEPELFAEISLDRIPKRERAVYESTGVNLEKIRQGLRTQRAKRKK